jgi:hypothetical protein
MFRCELSGRQSLPGQKPINLVIARKHRTYNKTIYNLEERTIETIKNASRGWEIVKALTVCESAAQEWTAAHPDGAEWVNEMPVIEEGVQDETASD